MRNNWKDNSPCKERMLALLVLRLQCQGIYAKNHEHRDMVVSMRLPSPALSPRLLRDGRACLRDTSSRLHLAPWVVIRANLHRRGHLGKGVAAVDNQVEASRVRGGVGGQEQEGALELGDGTLATMALSVCARSKYPPTGVGECWTYPMGVLLFHSCLTSASAKLEISVLMYPGETVLQRAKPVHSTAKLLPIEVMLVSLPIT